MMLAYMQK